MVGVAELRRRLGNRQRVTRQAALGPLAASDTVVPAGAVLELDATLEAIFDGVVATGTLSMPWQGPCRRCLTTVTGVARTELREMFGPDPVEGETFPLVGDHIDLEPLMRETALLSLPLAPLCDERCRGPVPDAFPTEPEVAVDAGDNAEPAGDPRWGALDELRFDR
ncbi:YceD family protein [soil metagenome]